MIAVNTLATGVMTVTTSWSKLQSLLYVRSFLSNTSSDLPNLNHSINLDLKRSITLNLKQSIALNLNYNTICFFYLFPA